MEKQFDIHMQTRKILAALLKRTPADKLVLIPQGFRNNIWWNTVHVVVTHQLLLYGRSGLSMNIGETWVDNYRKGTVPEAPPKEGDIEYISDLLLELSEKGRQDYDNGLFQSYDPYTTSNKVNLNSVQDAIAFNNFHEGLHLGVILSLLKQV